MPAMRSQLLDARGAALPTGTALVRLELQKLTSWLTRKRKTRAMQFELDEAMALGSDSDPSSGDEFATQDEANQENGTPVPLHLTTAENKPAPEPDVALAFASRGARVFVYSLFCMGVQMFMSYDGGALPASVDIIQKEFSHAGDAWNQAELGLLGAMDKIGTVVTSMPWGWLLQRYNAKLLLCMSLIVNAGASFAFGSARSKMLMYGLRFFMGSTQSLQGVWGTVWTLKMAPPDSKTTWLGLGAVSAGIGNGLGFAVAGFGTAHGMPYAFAFQAAALILAALWVLQVFVPSRWLSIDMAHMEKNLGCSDVACEGCTDGSEESFGAATNLRALLRNGVYVWTALAISLIMFVVSGIQFLWNQAFLSIWELDQTWVTLMMLVVTGAGSGVGIAFGPRYIDKNGGFGTYPGVLKSLRSLWKFAAAAGFAGVFGFLCLFQKLKEPDQIWGDWGDPYLYLVWLSIFFVNAAQNASVAALCGINMETVPLELRSFASGTEITIRNVLGFTLGPLLPGVLMTHLTAAFDWDVSDRRENCYQFICGLSFVLAMNAASPSLVGRASKAAKTELLVRQEEALETLRAAFLQHDADALCDAVLRAERVNLQSTARGQAVITVANREIGQLRRSPPVAQAPAASVDASNQTIASRTAMTLSEFALVGPRADIKTRAEYLERQVAHQQMLLKQQHAEIQVLRQHMRVQVAGVPTVASPGHHTPLVRLQQSPAFVGIAS